MYMQNIPTILVCLLFSTAIPTSLFNFKKVFLYLYTHRLLMIEQSTRHLSQLGRDYICMYFVYYTVDTSLAHNFVQVEKKY